MVIPIAVRVKQVVVVDEVIPIAARVKQVAVEYRCRS